MAGPGSVTSSHVGSVQDELNREELNRADLYREDLNREEQPDARPMAGTFPESVFSGAAGAAGARGASGASGGFNPSRLSSTWGRFLGRTGAAVEMLNAFGSLKTLFKGAKPIVEGALAVKKAGGSVSLSTALEMTDSLREPLSALREQLQGGIGKLQEEQRKKEADPAYQKKQEAKAVKHNSKWEKRLAEAQRKSVMRTALSHVRLQGANNILRLIKSANG